MVQGIITYTIILIATALAAYKSYRKLAPKKPRKSGNGDNNMKTAKSGCSECVAECILREAAPEFKRENPQFCERKIEEIKCS